MRKTGDAVREFQSKATREKHRSIMQQDNLSPTSSQINVYQTTQQDFQASMTTNNQNAADTLSDFMNGVNIARVKPIA